MTPNGAVCLVTLMGGLVVTRAVAHSENRRRDLESREQEWTVEYGDKENVVAFRSVYDGRYMRATAGTAYATIITDTKQWWTLERGHAPGSVWYIFRYGRLHIVEAKQLTIYRIKCNDFPDAYLANEGGSFVSGVRCYIWPKQVCSPLFN